jgi:predicted acyl esterase
MTIERDVPLKMDDGITLRADIYRPKGTGKYPAILNMGPYCKGLRFQDGYADSWEHMSKDHPEILQGSTCSYLTWETVDPERWVPDGYAVVRIDSRGAGRSPGYMDFYSEREIQDFYDCIEWVAAQPWCTGKIGLLGISYYAITQWLVAAKQPPHLTAILPWEGASDHYRDMTHHGGIFCNGFLDRWYPMRALPRQHGVGKNGAMDPWLNEPCAGPETLSAEELAKNRRDYVVDCGKHNLDDDFHKERTPDFSKIVVPLMSAGNWGGIGLHNRGNFEGYLRAASKQKWLSVHVGKHEEYFYIPYGLDIQKRFFDHFLKGANNGWDKEPPVSLMIRHPNNVFEERKENEWPIARTKWTKMYLDGNGMKLSENRIGQGKKLTFQADNPDLVFSADPFEKETEITGPLAAKFFIASSTIDADIYLTLRGFSPEGSEITFQGANEPKTPLGQGWLRASHRKQDPKLSKPYRPYLVHDEVQPLEPGKVYEVDIELWPTCIVLPAGYRIELNVGGADFERPNVNGPFKGSGPFYHTYAPDHPDAIYSGNTDLYTGGGKDSYLLLPIVPKK